MIIYRCVVSNDEMFSDAYKFKEIENGIFYEVEGKRITEKSAFNEASISANASTEEKTEVTEESSVSGVDIVLIHRLEETCFSKETFKKTIKKYMAVIKAHLEQTNPGRVEKFVADATPAILKILSNFKNYQFFTGETMHPTGMVALLGYREDNITPYMLFFKDGLLVEKC